MQQIQHYQPRKKNTAKVNVTISFFIHLLIVGAAGFWAAHEGLMGDKLKDLSVGLIAKEKKPVVKEKETKAAEGPKPADIIKKIQQAAANTPPPPKFVPPAAAESAAPPAEISTGGFIFDNSAITGTDPVSQYKQQVESVLRSHWERPADVSDLSFVAEVEVSVDATGKITSYAWMKGSGDARWDKSVKDVFAGVRTINRRPPSGFPEKFKVVFDVTPVTEPLVSRAD